MGPESILLSVKQDGREGSYRFTCPSCADDVEKRADRKIVALLVSAGVDIDRGSGTRAGLLDPETLFDELPEDPRGQLMEGPSFTIDDLIEFHFMLEDDSLIQEFLAKQ
jgi:hypothetical protein